MERLRSLTYRVCRYPRLGALGLGAISATGFQPLGLWPLALLAVGLLGLLIQRCETVRGTFLIGWLFGLGHFTLGNSWIATAFTYQANLPVALGWPAVPVIAAYLAIYPGLAAMGAKVLSQGRGGWALALGFAGCWIVAEWLRSWVMTGYAWNPLGAVLLGPFDRPGLAMLAPFMGTYALSGIAVLIGACIVLLLSNRRWPGAIALALLTAVGMYWPAGEGAQGTLAVTIAQPDIRQERLSNPQYYEANYQRLAQLSAPERGARNAAGPRLVLWPESGLVDYLQDGYPQHYYDATTALGSPEYARRRIGGAIGEGSLLLTGAIDLEIGEDEMGIVRATGAYNSITALTGEGEIVGSYAKAHLVPFGEYLPLRGLLEPLGLSRFVPGAIDFVPGPGPRTLGLGPWGEAGMLICYEIIFSGQVVDPTNRPDYIFNPSNDGWFGASGPPQHFAQARLRAIEEGLPVLRATTTGISGIVDARGVVRAFAPTHEMKRLDATIPPAAAPTLFARLGNWLALGWAMLFLGLARVALRLRCV